MPWKDLAAAADLPAGERLCVKDAVHPLVVVNTGGSLHAFANVCPHAGLPLEDGELRGPTVTCPFHGYTYSLRDGRDIDDPEFGTPLKLYPVRVEADRVQVELPTDAADDDA